MIDSAAAAQAAVIEGKIRGWEPGGQRGDRKHRRVVSTLVTTIDIPKAQDLDRHLAAGTAVGKCFMYVLTPGVGLILC